MKEDKLISETISLLRFPLTVFVVFIHYNMGVRGFSLHGVTYGLDAPEWFRWVTAFFSDVLPRTAVPLFYIISGYLFFRGGSFDTDAYRRKLRTRASTLLVPYLLWNMIAVLVQLSHRLPFLSSVFPSAHLMEVQLTPLRLFRTFFDNYWNRGILVTPENDGMVSELPYPADVPLWYVRDLMVMVLLAPVIWWLVRRAGRWLVVVLGAIWFLRPLLFPMWGDGWSTMLLDAAFFFSWGAYYGIRGLSPLKGINKLWPVALIYLPLAIADALTKGWGCNIFIHKAGILLGIVTIFYIATRLVECGKFGAMASLAGSSFLVFALHTLVMDDIGKTLFSVLHLIPSVGTLLLLYFIVPSITILFCLVMYLPLKHIAPPLCRLLTGGRCKPE
jgi:surface polysaccharide O-acyltransferase-like enzyme